MTFNETVHVLVQLGITYLIATQWVQIAKDQGKYSAIVINNQLLASRTITVHHGMIGNITHTYSIEIN